MQPDTCYHIYGRGNKRQSIFFDERNYDYFLRKAYGFFTADVHFISYCLMPNHFHFEVLTKPKFDKVRFANNFGRTLSSYTRGLQVQQDFKGSLFQQNSKKKELPSSPDALACFQYIHQNPLKAHLVKHLENWKHSSFNEYFNNRQVFCNLQIGRELLRLPSDPHKFYQQSLEAIPNRIYW
jgi:REP element-mobilizing transposase RayT